jgi:Prealbumin-like fold domain
VLSRIVFKRLRGRRLLAALATVTLVTGLVGSAVFAANTTLLNFEIDGDLPATTTNGITEDWVHQGNTGLDSASSALKCAPAAATCAPTVPAAGLITNVVDGAGLGFGELYRDWLKVDPDHTTFTNGDKENDFANVVCPVSGACSSDTPWHIVTGSVPPNKDDLFDVATNTYISGDQSELDIGMIRTNNNGSSHVDFELNRNNWTPGSTTAVSCATNTTGITGFVCPKRTEGDLLVSFEISPSGAGVTVATRYFVWDLPGGINAGAGKRPTSTVNCDGPLIGNENTCPWEEISAPATTVLVTSVNPAEMAAQPWGNRLPSGATTATIPQGGWFEAGLDLDALGFPPSCPGFGTASAKSRSSGSSVTSSLTDLAGPFPINLNNCADITVIKQTDPDGATQSFDFTTTGTGYTTPFSLTDGQSNFSGNLATGTYSVAETPVTGWTLTSATCTGTGNTPASITLHANDHITCTFNNRARGAIKILKESTKTGNPLVSTAGAVFSYGTGLSVTDNGAGDEDSTIGSVCVSNLALGDYTVNETTPPSGYGGASQTNQTATAVAGTNCTTNVPTGTGVVTFTNPPLSDIQVNFRDGGSGETSATITCDNSTGTGNINTTTGWDTTRNVDDISAPVTVVCTIVIDP